MRAWSAIVAILASLAVAGVAAAHEETKGGITVAHPWARATPGGVTNGGAYLEIKSASGVEDRLIAASSPAAGRAEIHTHIMEGQVMKMRRVESLPIASGSSVLLQPGGNHVMLFDLKAPLKEGDTVKLSLVFEKAGPIEVEATIEPIGAKGPHGMDHQPGHEAAHEHTMDHKH